MSSGWETASGPTFGGFAFSFGSTPTPRVGLGSVDKFVEVAEFEADLELVSSSDCTAGCDVTMFVSEVSSAGGGVVVWSCGRPRS